MCAAMMKLNNPLPVIMWSGRKGFCCHVVLAAEGSVMWSGWRGFYYHMVQEGSVFMWSNCGRFCCVTWLERVLFSCDLTGKGSVVIWYGWKGFCCHVVWLERVLLSCGLTGEDYIVMWSGWKGFCCYLVWLERVLLSCGLAGEGSALAGQSCINTAGPLPYEDNLSEVMMRPPMGTTLYTSIKSVL